MTHETEKKKRYRRNTENENTNLVQKNNNSNDVTYLMSKDVSTNKEQLCQSFWQSVKEQKFKAKKIDPTPPPGFQGWLLFASRCLS